MELENVIILRYLFSLESVQQINIHTRVTPDKTSSREIRLCPSLRSSYRSVMCFLTCDRENRGKLGRKLILLSDHPCVDSTLLTYVRTICLTAYRTADRGCQGDREKTAAVASCLCYHDISATVSVVGVGCHQWRPLLPQ